MSTQQTEAEEDQERPGGVESADWVETKEWVDALRDVTRSRGPERASGLLQTLQISAQRLGVTLPVTSRTPYVNTIPAEMQPRCIQWVEMAGRKHHLVGGKIAHAVKNPTWDPIAMPGAMC